MSISKGFLRNISGNVDRPWVSTGILLGLFSALALYAFSILFRELFRIYTYEFIGDLIVLTDSEITFYDFYYALVSSTIGASIGLQFIFQNSRKYGSPKLKISQRLILKNQYFNTWNWLYFYGKACLLIGILLWTLPLHFDIDFYNEFRYFFILFVIAMYLNLWLDMYRVLRGRLLRWIAIATALILVHSFLITKLSIVNYDAINTKILANTLSHNYRVNVPKTETLDLDLGHEPNKTHVYIGFNRHIDTQTPEIILKDYNDSPFTTVEPKGLVDYLKSEDKRLDNRFVSDHTITLHIDSGIKMLFVNELKNILEANRFRKVRYASVPIFSKYPPDYPGFDKYGLSIHLQFNCDFVIEQVDSLRSLGYFGSQVRFPDFPCYFGAEIINYNRVKLSINPNNLLLNGRPISKSKIDSFLWQFFKKYENNGLILIEVAPECTFGRYLTTMDLLRKPILKLRNTIAMQQTGSGYKSSLAPWDTDYSIMKQIEDQYPYNIIEMSIVDQYLYEYVK